MGEGGFVARKVWNPLLAQLRQGTSPEKLTWSVAAAITLATFPIFGLTTLFCAIAGLVFKLNHVVLQAVQYLATPLQIAAIPALIFTGETVFGLPHITYNPVRLANELSTAPKLFFLTYAGSAVAGIAVWLVLAPIFLALIRITFLPIIRRKAREKAPL